VANPEKHKQDLIEEWLEGDAGDTPPQSGIHPAPVSRAAKSVPRRSRRPAAPESPARPDPALVREPAPAAKAVAKQSPASSPDHLRRVERIPKLRAPYLPKGAKRSRGFRP
jgi:hypothetical protein